jgi:hypothetical protein
MFVEFRSSRLHHSLISACKCKEIITHLLDDFAYLTIGVLGFDSRLGLGIFLFTTAYRTALGPTQPPIQWVPGVLSLGVKRPEREADHSSPSSAKPNEWVELYVHSPNTPSWRGAQLKHGDNFTFTWLTLVQVKAVVAKLITLPSTAESYWIFSFACH